MNQNSYISEIKSEYRKIDTKWLMLHYHTSVGLVIFAVIVEIIFSISLYRLGSIEIDLEVYMTKYLGAPLFCNLLFVFIGYWATHSRHLKQSVKIYFVSFLFVAICFVFYTVHSIFQSLFLIFCIPILLTIVYGDHMLTTLTSMLSIFSYAISAVFIYWDPDRKNIFTDEYNAANFLISLCILLAFYAVCIVVIHFEHEKNFTSIRKEIERLRLQQKLLTDELTSINNRTALRQAMELMQADSENEYIFVMSDLDNFKMLNDKLGHNTGDQCLKAYADVLKNACPNATPFRFGGDEFCILFKNHTLTAVMDTCLKIQSDLDDYLAAASISVPLTASFGIADYSSNTDVSDLLKKADFALYRSKEVKNAINVYNESYDTIS